MMNVIQNGTTYNLYDEGVSMHNGLPAQAYVINFHPERGFWLSKYPNIKINEKVYGIHEAKAEKVLNSFNLFERNLGVILSGDKGIGKSLFSKVLAIKAINQGLPLILVDKYFPGVGNFLASIDQEVVVLFDEFDKTFGNKKDRERQEELLTLFDGLAQGKKLFIITCNDIFSLNEFLINRPGRFHYHFRFEYPNNEEVRQYLTDKLDEKYHGEIESVISFSNRTKINYDCLRAIAFELSLGIPFNEAIKDLNILHTDGTKFKIVAHFDNGAIALENAFFDGFDNKSVQIDLKNPKTHNEIGTLIFKPIDIMWSEAYNKMLIPLEKTEFYFSRYIQHALDSLDKNQDTNNFVVDKRDIEDAKIYGNHELDFITIELEEEKRYHYVI